MNLSKNKTLFINLIAQLFSFIVNLGINFLLTPYIVNNVGSSAYGFVSLGNNLITYIQVISVALNSMASRFITIKIVEGKMEEANRYFTSVLFANIFISVVLFFPSAICIIFLEHLLNIPVENVIDVKILFSLLYLNFVVGIVFSVYSVSTFAKNKIYLTSLKTIVAYIIKVIVLVVLFSCFKISIWYIGLAGLIYSCYIALSHYRYKKKLLPEIKINKKFFDIKKVKELVFSGVWNSITQIGQILLEGVDLLISNIFIGPVQMGILSISKAIPSMLLSAISTVNSVFMPDFTIEYAKGNKEKLLHSIKQSMKILTIFSSIPIAILIVYSKEFFQLWVPEQDAQLLQIISLISIGPVLISGGINCIYSVFTVLDKVKTNSICLISTGVINVLIVIVLLKNTNLGIFAVAGVSSLIGIIRNLCFTIPYGAKCLKLKWYTFYPDVLRTIMFVILVSLIGFVIKTLIMVDTWFGLILNVIIVGILGFCIEFIVSLNKEEKKYFISRLKRDKKTC